MIEFTQLVSTIMQSKPEIIVPVSPLDNIF